MDKTRIMLYVDDVEKVVDFWQDYLNAQIVEIKTMPDGSKNVILSISDEVELAFFATAFVAANSPEVALSTPSLMFFSTAFEDLHHQIPGASEIVDQQGLLTFNFADPEGHYFVVAKGK